MVNEHYMKSAGVIRKVFENEDMVELKQFLSGEALKTVIKAAGSAGLKEDTTIASHSYSHAQLPGQAVMADANKVIRAVTGKSPKSWEVWSFGWKGHLIVNDSALEKPGIDAVLDLTEKWNDEAGGELIYVDGSGGYAATMPEFNKLLIFRRNKGTHRFVRYVNHLAGKKRRLFLMARL